MTTPQILGPTTAQRLKPIMSVDMIKYHGRSGIQVDNLVPGGSPAEQDIALQEEILNATAWIDAQNLGLTHAIIDTMNGRVNVARNGTAYIAPRFRPIIGLISASLGGTPDSLSALTSLAGVGVEPRGFTIPIGPFPLTSSAGALQFTSSVNAPMDQAWFEMTYCSGWPVTTLTAAAAAGATILSVADTTGIIGGGVTQMRLYAQNTAHIFTVSAVSTATADAPLVAGPGNITITPALPVAVGYPAASPVMLTSMPADLVRAGKLVVRSFVKSSGGGNTSVTTAQQKSADPYGAGADLKMAYEIISNYEMVQR